MEKITKFGENTQLTFWEERCKKCGFILRGHTKKFLEKNIKIHNEVCKRNDAKI